MKYSTFLIIFTLFQSILSAQGWRKGEMEVMVSVQNENQYAVLRRITSNTERASADGRQVRAYLLPDELQKIRESGLTCEVIIEDLRNHYANYWDNPMVPPGYYSYSQIIGIIDSLATNFPAICKKVDLGTSLGGRQLAALKISDNVNQDEPEAEIMFDGGIHGDEVGAAQNVIMFAREICLLYGIDPVYTELIDNREIWLYPMVNPDGRMEMSRYNNNGVDINRDGGYMWNGEGQSTGAFSQVETKALRNINFDNQFVVYTNYHSGTEIISYPWSYRGSLARDYPHLHNLAGLYSSTSGYANLSYGQGYNVMYAINGSTKDWHYGCLGQVGWSMEISNLKQPPSSQILMYYNYNKPAMIEMIRRSGYGIAGMVTDSLTGEPVSAMVWVSNLYPVYTDPLVGDFHKYILPDVYTVKVTANGYQSKTITNVTVPAEGAAILNVSLSPATGWHGFKVVSCQIPGNNFGDEGFTPGALGAPDGVPYALGRYGWVVIDMKDTICNGPGYDFRIVQSGTTSKSFTVSGGNSIDGPFTTIGTGNGTTEFDLPSGQMSKARYLYIKDNATGSSSGPGAGFNLDAIEMLTPPLIVNFSTSTDTICSGFTTDFSDLSTGNPSSWQWTFQGGVPSTSTVKNPAGIRYDQPGVYNVTLTISNGMTSSTRTKTGFIRVIQAPVVSLGTDTALCAWQSITLDAGNPGASYLWSTGATSRTILVDSTGIGIGARDFWVDVSANDCTVADTIRITFETCTGENEKSAGHPVVVYPNPSNGRFTLSSETWTGADWMLLTPDGRVIDSGILQNKNTLVNLTYLKTAQGLYFLRVIRDRQVFNSKILIIK